MTDEQKQQTRERIGGRVATLRKMRGMTQEQLAEAAGIGRTHLNRIESGKYGVQIEVLQAVAEALHMTVDLIDPALQDLASLKKLEVRG